MDWQVNFTESALDTLRNISDRRIQRVILELARTLSEEPDRKGAPLRDEFSGYRSIRAAGQRYRIIYRVDENLRSVIIIAMGLRREGDRRDIYALAQRLVRLGLVEPTDDLE